jgi:hypothetical protein
MPTCFLPDRMPWRPIATAIELRTRRRGFGPVPVGRADPDRVLAAAFAAGTSTCRLPLVPAPGLPDLSLRAPALSIDPPADVFGATLSNGLAVTLGSP